MFPGRGSQTRFPGTGSQATFVRFPGTGSHVSEISFKQGFPGTGFQERDSEKVSNQSFKERVTKHDFQEPCFSKQNKVLEQVFNKCFQEEVPKQGSQPAGSQARLPGTGSQARFPGRGSQARFPERGSRNRLRSKVSGRGSQARFPEEVRKQGSQEEVRKQVC